MPEQGRETGGRQGRIRLCGTAERGTEHGKAWYNGGAEGGEGSHATPSDADDPRGRETIRSKEDAAHTLDEGLRSTLIAKR